MTRPRLSKVNAVIDGTQPPLMLQPTPRRPKRDLEQAISVAPIPPLRWHSRSGSLRRQLEAVGAAHGRRRRRYRSGPPWGTFVCQLLLPGVALDDYTVEIDGGSGDASIVATLKKGDGGDDGDANVVSNRASDSRTVTPVLVSDEADQEELEDYNVDADIGSYYVLVVVACDEFGSYNISFTNDVTEVESMLTSSVRLMWTVRFFPPACPRSLQPLTS